MKRLILGALAALFVSTIAHAHDGTYRQWCDKINGQVVCQEPSRWFGRWQICWQDGCLSSDGYESWAYKASCEKRNKEEMDSNAAMMFWLGRLVKSHFSECSETPTWKPDPRDPCIHPVNWYDDECRAYAIEALDLAGGVEPTPTPTPTPIPTPTPTPTPATLSLSGPNVENIARTTAQIVFSFDPPATGQTNYGTTQALGTIHGPETKFLASHRQSLKNLLPGTTYFYQVHGCTSAGVCATSAIKSFKTLP